METDCASAKLLSEIDSLRSHCAMRNGMGKSDANDGIGAPITVPVTACAITSVTRTRRESGQYTILQLQGRSSIDGTHVEWDLVVDSAGGLKAQLREPL